MTFLARRRLFLGWLMVAALAGSSGCGLKGPLYLPEESEEEEKNKEREKTSAVGVNRPPHA